MSCLAWARTRGRAPLGGHTFFGYVLAPWMVVPGMLPEVSSCLVAVACVLPGRLAVSARTPLWRVGVRFQCRYPDFRLCGGLLAWFYHLSCVVCPVLLLCAATDCVRCL